MTIAAVVVTYNRVDLLSKCLQALEQQDLKPDEIIVIDNASTDETMTVVTDRFSSATYVHLKENLGGAGGFSVGVDIAIDRGHTWAWLMDDDGIPHQSALKYLVAAKDESTAFVAAKVVDFDGRLNLGNMSRSVTDLDMIQLEAGTEDLIKVDSATFVGVLINLRFAMQTHLPLEDFFIWFDDEEYTKRLSKLGRAWIVPKAIMTHPMAPGSNPMGWKLYYYVRNRIWLRREQHYSVSSQLKGLVRIAITSLKQLRLTSSYTSWFHNVLRGYRDGLTKAPNHSEVGSMLDRQNE